MNDFKLYKKYRVIKNILWQTMIKDNLFVLWYYDNIFNWIYYHDFQKNSLKYIWFPFNIKDIEFNKVKIKTTLFYSIKVLREIISYSSYKKWTHTIKTLKKYDWFSYLHNSINIFEESLDKFDNIKEIVDFQQKILWKYIHEQFETQKLEWNWLLYVSIYYDLYSCIDEEIIIEKIWLKIQDILIIWLVFYLSFQKKFEIDANYFYWVLNKKKVEKFLNFFSNNITNFKDSILKNSQDIYLSSEKFKNYWKNYIFKYPIIELEWNYLSPLSKLILYRISNFIYFDISEWNKYWEKLWKANEQFIKKLLLNLKWVQFLSIDELDISNNKKIDYIIIDDKIAIFIECKSNSINLDSKENWLNNEDKKRLSKHLFQMYKYIILYFSWEKSYISNNNIKIIPIISYIYNPYFSLWGYENEILELTLNILLLDKDIKNKMDEKKIIELINKIPFFIIDNHSYVKLIDLINEIWLSKFYDEVFSRRF